MTAEEWMELFLRPHIGIKAKIRCVPRLRCSRTSLRLYFNSIHRVGVYFTAYFNEWDSRDRYPYRLWATIDPRLVKDKDKDPKHINVVPWHGMEEEAFIDLLRRLQENQIPESP